MNNDRHIGKTEGEFGVVQFFKDGNMHEYVRRGVGAEEAVTAFKFYTTNVAATHGIVTRVIIVDAGDNTNAEWQFGKGYTYLSQDQPPPRETGKQEKTDD